MSGLAARREAGPFVTYTTNRGDNVRLEIEPSGDGFMPVSGERPLGGLTDLFRPVFSAVEALVWEAREVHPDEVTVRFGIKLTGGGQAIVSKNVNDSNFEISLSWSASKNNQEYKVSDDE